MTSPSPKDAEDYAMAMVETLNTPELRRLLRRRNEDPLTVYRAAYMAGVRDTHQRLTPRANHMGSILKTMYESLETMTLKYDDLDVLNDLTQLHCLIAGYLVEEGDAILNSTKYKLAKTSGVPVEYIDDDTLISDIPNDVLKEIGLKVATANSKLYAVYVISGCKEFEEKTVTYDALVEMVEREGKVPTMKIDTKLMMDCLIPYGALQLRRVRKAYREVEKGLAVYKMRHERDATMLTMDLINKAKHGG